jgi:hypothetical protein
VEGGDLIHATQGLHYDVEMLDEETDVLSLTSMPQRVVAFLSVGRFLE